MKIVTLISCMLFSIQPWIPQAIAFQEIDLNNIPIESPNQQEQMVGLTMPQNLNSTPDNPTTSLNEIPEPGVVPEFDEYIPETPEMATQEDVVKFIRLSLGQRFGSNYYRETQSAGDLVMIAMQQLIFTGNRIEFVVVPFHINQTYNFDQAEYRWKVLKGDQELFALTDIGKPLFYYNFDEPGLYQVELQIQINPETILTSNLSLNAYNEVPVIVSPEKPAQKELITLQADYPGTNVVYEWTVNGERVSNNSRELTFQEFRGSGATYAAQVKIRTIENRVIVGAGTTIIEIPEPRASFQLFNDDTGERIPVTAQTIIENPTRVRIEFQSEFFAPDARLREIVRINNKPVTIEEGGSYVFETNPEEKYNLEIIVSDERSSDLVRRDLVINPHIEQEFDANLVQASALNTVDRWVTIQRYSSLGVFMIILAIGFYMTKFGKKVSL